MAKKETPKKKTLDGEKIGKAIHKLLGDECDFILVFKDEKSTHNLTNLTDPIEAVGLLEMVKIGYAKTYYMEG